MAESNDLYLTNLISHIDVSDDVLNEVTLVKVNLTESLLTPGLQTNVVVQSKIQDTVVKDLNLYYNRDITIGVKREILKHYKGSVTDTLETTQRIYKLSKRKRVNYEVEQFELDACDPSQMVDLKTIISGQPWGRTTPDKVTSYVISNVIGAKSIDIEASMPVRDYIAENITPYQVITQQSEVAESMVNRDPSFLHYMTYKDASLKDVPTHHFRSLSTLAKQEPVFTFTYSDKVGTNENYANPEDIMSYEFPCDFDMLSDLLNGYDENGNDLSAISVSNPLSGGFSMFGAPGAHGTADISAATNKGNAAQFNATETNVERHLRYRKARMALLEQDKIALRMTVPFNPNLSAGKVIRAQFINKYQESGKEEFIFGTGNYLILHLTHTARLGGIGHTTIDCVADTVAAGKV